MKTPFSELSLKNFSLTEFGFLWSLFFAAWGPVPRYFGWLLALIGLALEFKRGKSFRGTLDPVVVRLLLFILAWGIPVTLALKPDLTSFLKGYSLALEFAFSLWLSARVYGEEARKRFWTVLLASAAIAAVQSFHAFYFNRNFAGLFSNINTLGFYAVILLPLFVSRAFDANSPLMWILSVALLFITGMSSSTSAWITGVFSLCLLAFFAGRKYWAKLLLLLLCFLLFFGGVWKILERKNPKLLASFSLSIEREFHQIMSFRDSEAFTTSRSLIWKGAANLVRKRPLIGWGWGSFNEKFAAENNSWWDPKIASLQAIHIGDAHNMYLNLSIYGGIPTMAAVLWLFLFSGFRGISLSRKEKSYKWFWIGLSVVIFSQFLYSIVGDVFSVRYKFACIFWYYMGFCCRKIDKSDEINAPADKNDQGKCAS